MEGITAGALPRAIVAASGPRRNHRSARKARPIDRSRRTSQPTSRPGTSSHSSDATPCRRAAGPTRARTKEGATGRAGGARNKDTTTSKGGGQAHTRPGSTRNRESSHTRSSTRRAGPGAASRSQKHRGADKRTNRGSRHTASRSTADRRTRAPTITTGRETHTPTDRESTTATAGSPQRTGATPSPGLRVGAPSSCERQQEDHRPGNQALKASETTSGKRRPHATGGKHADQRRETGQGAYAPPRVSVQGAQANGQPRRRPGPPRRERAERQSVPGAEHDAAVWRRASARGLLDGRPERGRAARPSHLILPA